MNIEKESLNKFLCKEYKDHRENRLPDSNYFRR